MLIFVLNLFILQLNNDSIRYQQTPAHLTEQVADITSRVSKYLLTVKQHKPHLWQNVYVLSPNGTDRLGKPVPDVILSLNQYVQKSQLPMSVATKERIYFGGLSVEIAGITYRVYAHRIFSFLSGDYMAAFFQEFAYSILISAFLISFPLSFLLAYLVVGPIKRLQQATRDISNNINDKNNLQSLLARNDEFAELAKDFSAMSEQIGQQLSSRTRLISDVSHELRTPLSRMQIAIGIADNKLNEDGLNSELKRIKLEADRMNLMLSELLDFTRIDNLHCRKGNEYIDMHQFVTTLINDAKFEAEQVGISVDSSLQKGIYMLGNKVELLSCLENIIRNAIRYAKSNIHVYCHKHELDGQIKITIKDDGEGVPEEEINTIFDAFYRPELARARKSGGVGLGLSIAEKAVAAHLGKIWAENILPNGFAVHIELPIKSA
ncbi:ATP-binding protein [Thalassotalea fonticola]|uniref:histidine kinase n=1 Tax=Thalassotalea fonticola TaxID=3065649 RepID=A0ABZ0GV63_9GAMM|nr:ATP-binding protein [Colwelliaceae bacterium S1-1]